MRFSRKTTMFVDVKNVCVCVWIGERECKDDRSLIGFFPPNNNNQNKLLLFLYKYTRRFLFETKFSFIFHI